MATPQDKFHAIQAAFAIFDVNGDGSISSEELKSILMRPVGGKPSKFSEADVDRIMQKFDSNKDGVLSMEEFSQAWSGLGSYQSNSVLLGFADTDLSALDEDARGYQDPDERTRVEAVLRSYGTKGSTHTLITGWREQLFRTQGTFNDGRDIQKVWPGRDNDGPGYNLTTKGPPPYENECPAEFSHRYMDIEPEFWKLPDQGGGNPWGLTVDEVMTCIGDKNVEPILQRLGLAEAFITPRKKKAGLDASRLNSLLYHCEAGQGAQERSLEQYKLAAALCLFIKLSFVLDPPRNGVLKKAMEGGPFVSVGGNWCPGTEYGEYGAASLILSHLLQEASTLWFDLQRCCTHRLNGVGTAMRDFRLKLVETPAGEGVLAVPQKQPPKKPLRLDDHGLDLCPYQEGLKSGPCICQFWDGARGRGRAGRGVAGTGTAGTGTGASPAGRITARCPLNRACRVWHGRCEHVLQRPLQRNAHRGLRSLQRRVPEASAGGHRRGQPGPAERHRPNHRTAGGAQRRQPHERQVRPAWRLPGTRQHLHRWAAVPRLLVVATAQAGCAPHSSNPQPCICASHFSPAGARFRSGLSRWWG